MERTPPAKVEVPPETVRLPATLKYVVVELVPIPLVKLSVGKVARREYRSVDDAPVNEPFVAKRNVEERLVEVPAVTRRFPIVVDAELKFWSVDEPEA